MPVNISLLEANIYRGEWVGDITIEEVIASMQEVVETANDAKFERYVLLVDLTQAGRIPFDFRNLLHISNMDARVIEFVVINAPMVGQVLGNMLKKLSNQPFSFADTVDAGIQVARQLLEQSPEA